MNAYKTLDLAVGYNCSDRIRPKAWLVPVREDAIACERLPSTVTNSLCRYDRDTLLFEKFLDMHAYHFDSHALFRFSSQEDADAFDPNDAYACLLIGRDQYMTSWMSFGACQELHEFVDAQTGTPPFHDCVVPRAWSCAPFQDALYGDEEVHEPTAMPMACKRRFRLPMAVLFRYSGVGSSLCMPGCLQVRVPNTERAPVSVVFDHRTMSCLPTTLSTTIPGPTTWVLPVVQAPHEERLVVPMHGLCFLAAMMDRMDVTGAGIRNRCSMEYFPLKVVPLKTHTLVMPMQRLTWEALHGHVQGKGLCCRGGRCVTWWCRSRMCTRRTGRSSLPRST